MRLGSWFMLAVIILILVLNAWLAIKIIYRDYKLKKLEKKGKKSLEDKK